ncbi:hypothetical protein ACFWWM_35525 [Streptomyces sp. NPDC058682]
MIAGRSRPSPPAVSGILGRPSGPEQDADGHPDHEDHDRDQEGL